MGRGKDHEQGSKHVNRIPILVGEAQAKFVFSLMMDDDDRSWNLPIWTNAVKA
jgi:hypothetical protein